MWILRETTVTSEDAGLRGDRRIFASARVLREEEIAVDLLDRLTVMGICPLGAADKAPAFVEKRVWQATPNEEDHAAQVMAEAIAKART